MLTQYFQPEPIFKGLPLAKALRERGHEVEVLTGFPNYPGGKIYDGYRLRLWQREAMDGINVIRVPLFPSHNRSGLRRILNYLSLSISTSMLGPWLIQRPDVIYVYNLVTLGAASRVLRWFNRCKVVIDVQDLWPESVASSGMMKSNLAMGTLKRWCRRQYLSADRLLVLSPGFKENLVARGIADSKIKVVYNWCDETAITAPEPCDKEAKKWGMDGRFNIVFAGTMGVMQSLDAVLKAASLIGNEFPDVLFTFVGGGIDVDRLKSLSASLENVQFLPPQPQSEIGKVLANANALLVHLKDEPLFRITIPSKIQAYLYAGKPILCGVRGNAAKLVGDAGAGIPFEPENAESLADAICKMRYMEPVRLREMGLSGRDFYSRNLSFKTGVDQIESVFRDVTQA